jgi:hypothetical protein
MVLVMKARRKENGREKMKMRRQWLVDSPAMNYELLKLVLPGAWKPSDSSRHLPLGEGKVSQTGFLNGNQGTSLSCGSIKRKAGFSKCFCRGLYGTKRWFGCILVIINNC